MNTINIQDYVTQPAVNEAYSASLVDIKDVSVIPDSLEPGQVLKNSTDQTIMFGGGGTTGPVTHFEEPLVFDSIEDMEELNSYDVKGALVSYNSSTGKYTAWNGEEDLDARAWDYRADDSAKATDVNHSLSGEWINRYASGWSEDVQFPENEYGEVIAVCVGDGFWISTKWDPTNSGSNYKWCKSDGSIYSMQAECLLPKSGPECTAALTAKVTADDESLFWDVKNFGSDDHTQGHLYVPSSPELIIAKYNAAVAVGTTIGSDPVASDFTTALAHACNITSWGYWSSSQYYNNQYDAFYLDLGGNVYDDYKNGTYASFVLIRFGSALADAE